MAVGTAASRLTGFLRSYKGALLVVSLGVSTLTAYALPGLPTLVQQALAPPPIADFWLVLYLVARAGRLPRPDQQQDQTVSANSSSTVRFGDGHA